MTRDRAALRTPTAAWIAVILAALYWLHTHWPRAADTSLADINGQPRFSFETPSLDVWALGPAIERDQVSLGQATADAMDEAERRRNLPWKDSFR